MPNPLKLLSLKQREFQFIQELPIDAPPKKVWKTLLNVGSWWKMSMMGPKFTMKIEPWAGGRFFETAPDGREAMHAFVTYIEKEKLIRMSGPMGASYAPANSVIIFELQSKGKGTLLRLCHRGSGAMTKDTEKNFKMGWSEILPGLKEAAEK